MKRSPLPEASVKAIKDFALRMAFLLCSATIFMLLAYYIPQNTRYEYTDAKRSAASGENVPDNADDMCTLVLENGSLVIYSADGERSVTDADTESLTEYDIQLLTKGILASRDEIYELIGSIDS